MNAGKVLFLLLILGFKGISFAHEEHRAKESQKPSATPDAAKELQLRLEKINMSYKKDVKPIFLRSCFDCHSQSPNIPWYHSLPLVHGLLEGDMKEAKVHLDFSNDFPFKGHGSPDKDLKAIAKTTVDGSMPPFRYRTMHWNSELSEDERKIILKWIDESQQLLNRRDE